MPCYLFTFHAYGSWMPDRRQGYVARGRGALPRDEAEARRYRQRAKFETVSFERRVQRLLVDETQTAAGRQRFRVHAVATDPTHVHILLSWRDIRTVLRVRMSLKSSLTRRLNREVGRRTWFVENASRKRVRDGAHFEHLMTTYLPAHRGVFWREGDGALQ